MDLKNLINVRNCFRILLHSFKKQSIVSNLYFDSGDGFHSNNAEVLIYKPRVSMSSGINRGWQFLQRMHLWVSLPYAL